MQYHKINLLNVQFKFLTRLKKNEAAGIDQNCSENHWLESTNNSLEQSRKNIKKTHYATSHNAALLSNILLKQELQS